MVTGVPETIPVTVYPQKSSTYPQFSHPMDDLNYRRQFLACSEAMSFFPNWKNEVFGNLYFKIHPDLNAAHQRQGENELLLLGILLDPDHPQAADAEILQYLLANSTSRGALIRATDRLGGRWLIFARHGDDLFCFADPCGLRQLVYTDPGRQPFILASQPGLITSKFDGYPINTEVQEGYLESRYFRSYKEFWWPAGLTFFEGIAQLAPNHLLDLRSGEPARFWPAEQKPAFSLDEGARRSGELLHGLMKAAHHRFKLALPLTAGYDSRAVLAAAKDIAHDIFIYTGLYYGLDSTSPDVCVPRGLLKSLGLAHHVIDFSLPADEAFKKFYFDNVSFAHPAWLDIAYGSTRGLPDGAVCVKGNASEIVRSFYYKYFSPLRTTGRTLSFLAGFGNNPFIIRHFDDWLNGLSSARRLGYDPLDLLYWEHRMGVWQAASQLEFDLAAESFTPFNNRALLVTLLGVPRRYRRAPDYALFKEIMRHLWPEVLEAPFNPSTRKGKAVKFAKSFLRRFGIVGLMKRLGLK
jgi:hypothetical protein